MEEEEGREWEGMGWGREGNRTKPLLEFRGCASDLQRVHEYIYASKGINELKWPWSDYTNIYIK